MALSDFQLLDVLSQTPFVDSTEFASILGEPHSTVHRALADLLADGIAGRVSHGTVHMPSSRRHFLTTSGAREAAGVLGFDTPSDFVCAYPMSREWLTLLIRWMDAVASVYRLAATMPPATTASGPTSSFIAGVTLALPPHFTTVAASEWCAKVSLCDADLNWTG